MKSRLDDIYYMQLALDAASKSAKCGEVPVGAVVVYDPFDSSTNTFLCSEPKLLACCSNKREQNCDPAGHAEFLAIRKAARKLNSWRLCGCTVYVTLEPCIMCAGLMHQSRIDACVYGAPDNKAGALGTLYSIHEDKRLNHNFEVRAGVCANESKILLKDFFAKRRR